MKEKQWLNGNKMKINTGHKTFDKQTTYITEGNVLAATQYGSHIRPYNLTLNPVNEKVLPGYLQ